MPKRTFDKAGGIDRRRLIQLMTAAGLAGPSLLGSRAFAQDKSVLRMLTEDTDDPEIAWYKAVNAAFEQAHPDITIEYDAVGMSGLFEKLTPLLASGQPPDMVPRSGQSRVATLANLGVLQPVDDIVDALGPRDDFLPGIIDAFTFDGQLLAVPQQSLAYVYWYRKDLAADAGLSPPTNWDELLAFAKALTKDGMYGIVLPAGLNTATSRKLFEFFRENGGNIVDEDLNVAINSPQNKETLEFLKELYQYSPPGSANYGYGDLLTNFTSGIGASTYYAGRMLQRVAANAPDIAKQTGAIRQPYKTEPFCFTEASGAYILDGARNRDAAKAWMLEYEFEDGHHIDWLLTAPAHNLPVRKSIAADPRYKNFPLLQQFPEILEVVQTETGFGGSFYRESPNHKPNPQGGALDTGPILPTLLQRVLVNNEAPDSALAWAERQVQDLMDEA
jgi:multiple sugar transport system substrate-binding protein